MSNKADDKVFGYVGLAHINEYNKPEILYGFNENYWHQGYATEAAARMKELAIDLKIESLIAFADINNSYSNKVLVKTGYKYMETIKLWGLNLNLYKMNLGGKQNEKN